MAQQRDLVLRRAALMALYEALASRYGPQHWWPADGCFEVMVGAVLTQNTAWNNVERAIDNLRAADLMAPERILAADRAVLADQLRPSGYFNVKAARLCHLCRFVIDAGGVVALTELPTETLRRLLLEINGIGPETADDILLYAFERPVFVIDAYTRRLLSRMGEVGGDEPYEWLRAAIEEVLPADVGLFNEFHALIVRHAKAHCAKTPRCSGCPVRGSCRYEN